MAFPSSDDITVPSTDEELKAACRLGLHPALRRSLWRRLVKAEPRADFYSAACVRVFGSAQPKPSRLFRVPFLGNTPWAAPPDIVPLLSQPSVSTSSAHDRIVCVLAQLYGLVHCPMAANLALLLLAHASEAESFAVLESLLSPAAGERRLFQTPSDDAAFARAFMEVTRERHPQLIRHLETCGRDAALRMFESWFRTLFYGWLPFADVLCIVDVFLSEGPKALIRLGMAWLRARKRALKRCSTIDEVEASLRGWVAGAAEPDDAFAYTYPAMAEHGFALRRLGRDVIAGYMTQALRRAGGSGGGGSGGGGIGGGGSGGSVAGLIAGAVSGSIRRGISGSAAGADDDDDDDDDGGMGAARWQGHPTDFLFQLQPHVTLFPAHPPSAVAARAHSVPPAGAHEHGLAASAAPAAAGAGAPAHRHAPRLHLSSDRMTLSTSDFTAFGGARSSTAVALRLPDTFSRCTASAELLFELGLISARDLHDAAFGVEPEVELHGLEAFGLVDGSASVSFSRSAAGRLGPASLARVDAAEKKERAEAAELAEQQAHAFGGEAAVADLKARVSRLVGDERGAAEANRVAAEFEARQRDAAARATAFRG
ncbi:hypothetical protein FNF29_04222 [Cafeteria roenbergensis]|uniref:Rab-GAP TBC domain-containing protein n=1 Tax=Cafeteria roenbergensis TaxID=33653 RepID=A0A5A8CH11_CAFRO|nr:hypothetical protein FNF29_04222 [Cafeteria roenbergensis]|eukprot:KAA0152108.1 hypothetical protein FNF29_04222 [Cafeteria roenbergensis]